MRNRLGFLTILIWICFCSKVFGQEHEATIEEIALRGYLEQDEAEVSGMTWYKDHLIILPQYPEKQGEIYALPKAEIAHYLAKKRANQQPNPLEPKAITFKSQSWRHIDTYEGYEAIVIHPETGACWLTIEMDPEDSDPYSILVQGKLDLDLGVLSLDIVDEAWYSKHIIPSQSGKENMAEETLVFVPLENDQSLGIISIHEANGLENENRNHGNVFSLSLKKEKELDLPIIPYRVTDATTLDAEGRFWVINYFYPGDRFLEVKKDSLLKWYGIEKGPTHQVNPFVERLVELRMNKGEIVYSPNKPIQLTLDKNGARNWEGIVRWDDTGFLIISDEHPRTILAFIAK